MLWRRRQQRSSRLAALLGVFLVGCEPETVEAPRPRATPAPPETPAPDPRPPGPFLFVAAGRDHCLAVDSHHTVWSWGNNSDGQLGHTAAAPTAPPRRVPDLGDVVRVAGGNAHSVALTGDGSVWTWGSAGDGRLGNGLVDGTGRLGRSVLDGATMIAVGGGHTLATRENGTLWAWGLNRNGEVGDGSRRNAAEPVQILGPSNLVALDAGPDYSLALASDGMLWAWGNNHWANLGTPSISNSSKQVRSQRRRRNDWVYPDPVKSDISHVDGIAAGGSHVVVVRSDRSVWGWGSNRHGALGHDPSLEIFVSPARIPGISDAIAVAAGERHSVVLRSDGRVWTWGANDQGQLGIGSFRDSRRPRRVPGLNNITAIAAGAFHTMALSDDGRIWLWGSNRAGQLGASFKGESSPEPVLLEIGGD